METKHTPGPWSVAYYASQDGSGGTSHYSVKLRNKTIVRTVNEVATEQDEANVSLIAAAPEMLAALKPFADEANLVAHTREDSYMIPVPIKWLRMARQAIAKAERKEL